MTPFELVEPASLKEAIALIDPDDPEVRPIAGGTALMLMMKAGVFRPRRLVSLRKLGDEFTRIAAAPSGELTIGAMAPLVGARAFARGRAPRAGDRAHHEAAVECARAQCGDRRRRAGAWRSAHGPAAGADRARRGDRDRGPDGRAQLGGRGPAHRLLRNRARQERADHRIAHSGAGRNARGLFQGHRRLGRRLAGARRRGRARCRRRTREIRAHRGERGDGQGHAAEIRRAGADRRRCERQDACQSRRSRRGGSRHHRRPARLGFLQARTAARLCRARGARGHAAEHH